MSISFIAMSEYYRQLFEVNTKKASIAYAENTIENVLYGLAWLAEG